MGFTSCSFSRNYFDWLISDNVAGCLSKHWGQTEMPVPLIYCSKTARCNEKY